MKSPAFQFYPKQWLGDNHVALMDWDVRGMHIHLMSYSWQEKEPGTLQKNEEILQKLLNFSSKKLTKKEKKDWENRIFPQLSKAWPTWEEDETRIVQKGVRSQYLNQLKNKEKATNAANAKHSKEKNRKSSSVQAENNSMLEGGSSITTSITTSLKSKQNRTKHKKTVWKNSGNNALSPGEYKKFERRFETAVELYPNSRKKAQAKKIFMGQVRSQGIKYYRELVFAIGCEFRTQYNAERKSLNRSPPALATFFESGYLDYESNFLLKNMPEMREKTFKL